MTETPEQIDERRARAMATRANEIEPAYGRPFDAFSERQRLNALSLTASIRASDASAGMVTVPVELLHRAWKKIVVDPFKAELAAEIDAILRQAQEPDHE